ncbi:MAG: hypothetical protein MUE85_05155 [Microscillaceae bacterium]|jgi:hypothetical protein|nr:hypothetical protein [Microscillaceae bacterium]
MAKSKQSIISEIEQYIRSKSFLPAFLFRYSAWYCGITSDKEQNSTRHKKPKHHKFFKCTSEKIAREIEIHFHEKGMKGSSGGGTANRNVDIVYIFKKYWF